MLHRVSARGDLIAAMRTRSQLTTGRQPPLPAEPHGHPVSNMLCQHSMMLNNRHQILMSPFLLHRYCSFMSVSVKN